MSVPKIEKLEELLNGVKITNHETTNLTAMGENYGSLMLAVKIYTENEEGKNEILQAVAKLPPPSEFLQIMFNTPITFRNEYHCYKTAFSEFESFLHQKNIYDFSEYFPKFLGGRSSFQSDKEFADNDAVIILENLKLSRYVTLDRIVGFDLDTAKLILRALAKFHATPLAFKLQRPELFRKLIKPIAAQYKVFDFNETLYESVTEMNRKIIEGIESCRQYADKLVAVFKAHPPAAKNAPEFIREPFATLIHTDAWVNNFMLKYDQGKPTGCKIVDFQLVEYGSPARDVIFFLYTSVQIPVLQQHYEQLIDFYHRNLIQDLEEMGCDVAPFSRQEFEKEIVLAVREFEFVHCVIMLKPIFATKDSLKNLDEYKEDDLIEDQDVSPEYKDRAAFIVEEFVKKNWI